ncbi:hypothetical protein FQN57_002490 [Myotisia sp. PD_48]|nr:hypothetical protein FQN57_002490 [Myotisia sp. PD_48]
MLKGESGRQFMIFKLIQMSHPYHKHRITLVGGQSIVHHDLILKVLLEMYTQAQQAIDEILLSESWIGAAHEYFTRPNFGAGWFTYPRTISEIDTFQFQFFFYRQYEAPPPAQQEDSANQISVTRTVNVFQMLPALTSQSAAAKNWRRKRGTYSTVEFVEVPRDATREQFTEIMMHLMDLH